VVLASQSAKKNADREAALREDGIDAVAVQFDVDPMRTRSPGWRGFVAGRGPLRTLAHVAGLSPSAGDWHQILGVNLIGTALTERACLELAVPGTAAVFVVLVGGPIWRKPPAPDIVGRPRRPAHAGVSSAGWTGVIAKDWQTPFAGLPAVENGRSTGLCRPPGGPPGEPRAAADRLDVAGTDRHPRWAPGSSRGRAARSS